MPAEQERRGEPGVLKRAIAWIRASARAGFAAKLLVPILPVRHPLSRRECALENDLRFRLGWILFTTAFGAAVALILAGGYRIRLDEELHTLFIASTIGVVLVALIVMAAVSVTGDKRSGKFEAMLAANVEPEDLVRARLAGLLLRAIYLLLAPVLYGIIAVLYLEPSWEAVWRLAIGLVGLGVLTATTLLLTIGIAVRCRWPSWAAALSLVFALPPALFLGAWIAATPATFAIGVPLAGACLLGAYAAVVRKFRAAALR